MLGLIGLEVLKAQTYGYGGWDGDDRLNTLYIISIMSQREHPDIHLQSNHGCPVTECRHSCLGAQKSQSKIPTISYPTYVGIISYQIARSVYRFLGSRR